SYMSKQASHKTYEDAIQMFNAALVHDNEFVGAFTGLCEAYRGKFQITSDVHWISKASLMCGEALKINSEEPKALERKGLLLADKGDIEGAISVIESARKIDPRSSSIVNALASVYLKNDDPEKAEVLHKAAVDNIGRASCRERV